MSVAYLKWFIGNLNISLAGKSIQHLNLFGTAESPWIISGISWNLETGLQLLKNLVALENFILK